MTSPVRHKQARYIAIKKLFSLQLKKDLIDRQIEVSFQSVHYNNIFW